jgi:signal transduction histidine kinase
MIPSDSSVSYHQRLTPRLRLYLVLTLTILAAVSYIVLYPRVGRAADVFPAIPVVTAAGLLGLRAGLIAFALNIAWFLIASPLVGLDYLDQLRSQTGILFTLLLALTTFFFGRMHDISRRLQDELHSRDAVEKSLIETQRLNKRITETIPDTLWIWELDTRRVVYINQQPPYLPDLTVERLKQDGLAPLRPLVHPDDMAAYATADKLPTLADDAVYQYEYRVRQPDGSYRLILAREIIFSRKADGRPRYILNVEQDITQDRQAQETRLENEKLQFALGKEREMTRLRSRLMETIAHEFRTPLSIIMASGELIEMYLDRMSPERRAECLHAIKTQSIHLREMLNDLHLILEQEAHPPVFRPEATNIRQLCETLIETLRLTAGAGYTLQLNFQGELTAIQTDRDLLLPVLQNLLSNAFKYSPAGSTVDIEVAQESEHVVYRVRDQGIGIPADDRSHIYDTFYRAQNTVSTSGLGIGLKIVRDYVRLHQGTVEVTSEPGKGSTFTVRLPLSYAPEAPKTT